jgi:upstream activation factor subunit UAF30
MPRVKKTTTTATTEAPVASTTATATKKTTSKKRSTKTTTQPVVETVVATPDVAVETTTAPVQSTPLSELTEVFSEFSGRLNQLSSQFTSLKNDFRGLEKRALRELKAAQKLSAKKQRKNTNRQPSGFVKPTKISSELATFLGKEPGTEMARTEVTREINKYIRANNLQDAENGRKINPDKSLRTLLKIPTSEQLTYFNLQRYMSPHFAKMGQAVTTA